MLVGSVNKHSSIFKASVAVVTGVSNQLVEILIELVNTCCFLISAVAVDDLVVKPWLFACETRRLVRFIIPETNARIHTSNIFTVTNHQLPVEVFM